MQPHLALLLDGIIAGVRSPDATPNADLVHARWRTREAPHGDFIIFSDGSLSVMELVRSSPAGRLHDMRAETWQWWEVLRATEWTPNDWMDVDTTLASCVNAGSRALAGESSDHGSIGWVALAQDDDHSTLEWIAVSCSSNPFTEVTLDATTVTATSTLGRIWTFPRNTPQQVKITEDPAYPWASPPQTIDPAS
ncbi:hypothetical protein PV721_39025 [Streptomyces sp. MB09-01]|uniref:hypothetical protein n=1 Tax=Streptomyces sp. MB09-01 TaxID=3028666 RepID=UPI0029BDA7DB|nr:hypothetical protein [Streptomyces sp. MB09-01]MDX3540196.1 hypothetical protein [Streptomyces sp. MB09-01]